MPAQTIIRNARVIFTCAGGAPKCGPFQADARPIRDASIVAADGIIRFVGPASEANRVAPAGNGATVIDASGCTVVPGFVDPHTHVVFGGDRREELRRRLAGATYAEIAAEGGGILATVRATRDATEDELAAATRARLDQMLLCGTTTCEAKSGYGLQPDAELKMLRVLRRLNAEHPIDIAPTFMGAHEIPVEHRANRRFYIDQLVRQMIPAAARDGLAEWCDVFCEAGVYTPDEAEEILEAGKRHGLKPRIHADELAESGGSLVAAKVGARSADHLLHVAPRGIHAMKDAGVVATLLPIAAFYLKLGRFAPARELVEGGVPVALATDLNPGGGFSPSMPFAMALACFGMRMTMEEALVASTINAAYAIDRHDQVGSLEAGKQLDAVILDGDAVDLLKVGVPAIRAVAGQNEAFSRILIDKALEFSGWNLLSHKEVRFEMSGLGGRADYVFSGERGPLAVLEAKKESVDPYDAREQARGYAENLNAPFVILSNGTEHWFWNYTRTDQEAYRIERLPSLADLERLRLKNLQPPRPLLSEIVGPDYLRPFRADITVRRYQIKALDLVSSQFDADRRRKFLLEMATGTGKTLLCAALIRRFLVTRNAERVLFIVDRIELAKQTLEDFAVVLAEFKPVLYKTARRRPGELLGSSVVVATLQSLMVDRRYREEFTPFHFDLVVNDEAHRSIYGDAREVVQFFQATRVGLTATPRAYLKNVNIDELRAEDPAALEARLYRDTYHYFGCAPGFPTYRYDIVDAVKDPEGPFLCLPKIFDLRSDITTKALAESGWAVVINEQQENFKIRDLERKIFTPTRNRVMCEAFLIEAQRDPSGALGKSIVFAVNQSHATALTKIFNQLQPGVALTITSRVPDASAIAKEFRDGKRTERIAVSVDMLSTGYNCRDVLNIGLMRPIFSPTEFIQIKGRGTRLFTFKLGETTYEKQRFFLIDFCAVAEFFEEKYDYTAPLKLPREPKKVYTFPADPDDPSAHTANEGPPCSGSAASSASSDPSTSSPPPPREIPVWEGTDSLVAKEVIEVGPDGQKVDVMTFRGSFEQDLAKFAATDPALAAAIADEDDDAVEAIMNERFYHRPRMYYSADKLVLSYGIPAPTPAFVYNAVGKKPLPTRDAIVADTVDSLAARFNLRYNEQKWVAATAQLLADDPAALRRFAQGDMTIFTASQFRTLGGIEALARFERRDEVFAALRASTLVRQSLLVA